MLGKTCCRGVLFRWRSIMVGGRGGALKGRKGSESSPRMADCLRVSPRFQISSANASSSRPRHFLWDDNMRKDIAWLNVTNQKINDSSQKAGSSEYSRDNTTNDNAARGSANSSRGTGGTRRPRGSEKDTRRIDNGLDERLGSSRGGG
jgi:hypothetical protein